MPPEGGKPGLTEAEQVKMALEYMVNAVDGLKKIKRVLIKLSSVIPMEAVVP